MSTVTVTFVGTGDAFGSGGRLQTCIVVEGSSTKFAIDFGTSSMIGLRRQSVDPNSIDTIVLTHLHGDHCGGIPFLLLDAMLGSKRKNPLTIVGPRDSQAHLEQMQEVLFPGSGVMAPDFDLIYREVSPGTQTEIGGLLIDCIEARHTRETNPLAVRVSIGEKTIAYTGDGELTEGLIQLVEGVDLLIAESYFYDKPVRGHLSYSDIGKLNGKRIVLTHMHSHMLEQADKVSEECAYDGYTITV